MNDFPYISIVVLVLNRERTIGKCVQSLMDLDYPSYEVIVVDNGSTDKTYEIVSQFPVKLVTEAKLLGDNLSDAFYDCRFGF